MKWKYTILLTTLLAIATGAYAQGTFKPRDADEEHAWRLYNQYIASKQKDRQLREAIARTRSDIRTVNVGSVPGLGIDPTDVAALTKYREQLKAEKELQQKLEGAWERKFWGRYGDLADSEQTIYDPTSKQTMDKIRYRLIAFPFNYKGPSPAGGAAAGSFPPGDPFNGLKVSYSVTGAAMDAPVDGGSFTITRNYTGVLGTGTLSITGTARVGGFGADVSLTVWAGDKKAEKKFYIENVGGTGNPQSFSLSVAIPPGARTGGFSIHLDGRYSMGGGHRGCYVDGSFAPKEQAAGPAGKAPDKKTATQPAGESPAGEAIISGDALHRERSYADAIRKFDEAIRLEPDKAAGYRLRGRSKREAGDLNGSLADFETAVKLAPEGYQPILGRGLTREKLGDRPGAMSDFDRGITLNPNYSGGYTYRGRLKFAMGDLAGARADFDRSIALDPLSAAVSIDRGLVRGRQKDYLGAIDDYNWAMEIDPRSAVAFNNRGAMKQQLGDLTGALADYEKALELNPNYQTARSNIEKVNAKIGGQGAPAKQPAAGLVVVAIFENRSNENVHIFVDGGAFAPENRLTPGEKREVKVTMAADGRIKFVAGRNGQTIATKTWNGDPQDQSRFPRVIFDGKALAIMTGLR